MKTLNQQGFSLITAIFLLVVLATLMGYMVSLRVVQQQTVVMSIQGARALQAARAGIEYG
ncbi:MAG: pilus assembly protein MshP, partial [Gammaproteobacteria bacterium]|nr:pilus assembly protein MshP [Gammaproteobacteria bacterium]